MGVQQCGHKFQLLLSVFHYTHNSLPIWIFWPHQLVPTNFVYFLSEDPDVSAVEVSSSFTQFLLPESLSIRVLETTVFLGNKSPNESQFEFLTLVILWFAAASISVSLASYQAAFQVPFSTHVFACFFNVLFKMLSYVCIALGYTSSSIHYWLRLWCDLFD